MSTNTLDAVGENAFIIAPNTPVPMSTESLSFALVQGNTIEQLEITGLATGNANSTLREEPDFHNSAITYGLIFSSDNLSLILQTAVYSYAKDAQDNSTSAYFKVATLPTTVNISGSNYNVTAIHDDFMYDSSRGEAYDFWRLTSIILPTTVKSIGIQAFQYCYNAIISIEQCSVLESIGSFAFAKVNSTSIVIPNTVTYIGNGAFSDITTSLTTIKSTNVYFPVSSLITVLSNNVFLNSNAITSITLPPSLVSIGDQALSGCSFKSITIPSAVTSIGSKIFATNISLSSITFETKSINSFGTNLFTGCSNLTSIVFPGFPDCLPNDRLDLANATIFPKDCFNTKVSDLSDSIYLKIYPGALQQMRNQGYSKADLVRVGFNPDSIPSNVDDKTNSSIIYNYSNSANGAILISVTFSTPNTGIATLPNDINLTTIEANVFAGLALKSIIIPNTVTSIGASVFSGCTALTSVTFLTKSITSFGTNVFSGCSSLTNIEFPGTNSSTRLNLLGLQQNCFKNGDDFLDISDASLRKMQDQGYSKSDLMHVGFEPGAVKNACFGENAKILCFVDGQEKELRVKDIRNGVLVKTIHCGYKPVCMIGTSKLMNPANNERFNDRLFICKKEKYPELNEDLIITGCHSILIDNITEAQRAELIKQVGDIYVTEGKYRLIAAIDERSKPYECGGEFDIYHFALENDNYFNNYGVYANGLLVESCSKRYLKELSGMRLL